MKKLFILLTVSAAMLACEKDKTKEGTFTSEKATLHGGKVWSSVKLNKEGKPEQLSIAIDDAAMNSVPVGQPTDHIGHANNIILPIHKKGVENTPFKFIMVNWNSSGHEPENVYTSPHFDFHFYMTPSNEVMNYLDTTKLNHNIPAADYLPPAHISPAPGVPTMGKHWLDVTSPELSGAPFTQTFIYGSYDSKVVFLEPMITLDFLKNTTSFERQIPQPAKFKTAGFYPTKMKVIKANGITEIVLDGFVYRQAS